MLMTRKGLRRRLRKTGFRFSEATKAWTRDVGDALIIVPEHMLPAENVFDNDAVSMFRLDKAAAEIKLR